MSWTQENVAVLPSQNISKLCLGTAILLYGYHFPGTILFASSMRISGVLSSNSSQQIKLLAESASKTAEAMKQSAPSFLSKLKEIGQLNAELDSLKKSFEANTLSRAEYIQLTANLEADIARASRLKQELTGDVNSLLRTINIEKIQEVLSQLFSSLTACVAAASSKYIRYCSVGFTIGKIISDRLLVVMMARRRRISAVFKRASLTSVNILSSSIEAAVGPETQAAASLLAGQAETGITAVFDTQDWITPTVRVVGNCIGWIIAYYLQGLAQAASACSIGAEMVVTSIQELSEPLTQYLNMPSLKSPQYSEYIAGVQTILSGLAFTRVMFASKQLPGGLLGSIALMPLSLVESSINAMFLILGVAPVMRE